MRFGISRCEVKAPGTANMTICCQKININGLGVVGLALLEDDGWEDIARPP